MMAAAALPCSVAAKPRAKREDRHSAGPPYDVKGVARSLAFKASGISWHSPECAEWWPCEAHVLTRRAREWDVTG